MIPAMLPSFVPPLTWLRYNTAPTQFASRKNAPGIDYDALKATNEAAMQKQQEANQIDEPATTPAPDEITNGDLKQKVMVIDSGVFPNTDAVRAALEASLEKGQLEVQELPKQE